MRTLYNMSLSSAILLVVGSCTLIECGTAYCCLPTAYFFHLAHYNPYPCSFYHLAYFWHWGLYGLAGISFNLVFNL